MSNARNLANLLGAGTTIATASIADDAITDVKIGDALDDRLTLDGSSVATVTVNSAVSSSATIAVDGVSGTIAVGMVVNVSDTTVRSITDAASQSAISVDDTLTITAVASQTSFTVSEAVSIADNVVLILRADENSKMVLDASAASTDVGDEILFEDATNDGSSVLNSGGRNGSLPSVIQIVQGGRTSRVTYIGQTYVDIGVDATITPTSTSSKIFIMLTGNIANSLAGNYTFLKLFRGSTEIGSGTGSSNGATHNTFFSNMQGAADTYELHGFGQTFLDEDVSTTSEVTYKIQMATYNGVGSLGGRGEDTGTASPTRLTLMEIAG
jgi:hypothetical protein